MFVFTVVLAKEEPVARKHSTSAFLGRSTRQRVAVMSLLEQRDDFRSAQELHEELRTRGETVGLTTVYRTLQFLANAGEVDVLRVGSGEAVYRRCSRHRHHHLVCRMCGHAVEVDNPAIERWARAVAAESGFSDGITVEVFGTCAECTR